MAACTAADDNPADEDDNKPAAAADDNYYNAAESSSQSHKAAAAALVAVVEVASSWQSHQASSCWTATRRCMSPSRQKIGVHPVSVRIFPFRVHVLSQCFEEAAYCHYGSLHRYHFRKLV